MRQLSNPWMLALIATLMLAPAAAAQFSLDLSGFDDEQSGFSNDPVTLDARIEPAADGQSATLVLTADIEPGWHVFSITQPPGGPQRTQIVLDPSSQYRLAGDGKFAATPAPKSHIDQEVWKGLELQDHEERVVWSAPIELLDGATAESIAVTGVVRGQACKDVCLPIELKFAINADAAAITPAGATAAAPLSIAGGYDLSQVQLGAEKSFAYYLLWAFVGGMALNLMPCVLPVIGLKVMSFVDQAGKNRFQAFALNMWYSLGILAVFWVLAVMAITAGYRWNDQGASPLFNVIMSTLVMAMGLSLLGVWEIPIPGFLGSGKTQQAANKEGALGALLKGVITTLLAIPCTGPGMAVALGWAIGKESWVVGAVFTAIGVGMASPYLLIGAFPGLVKFLPKPGTWMESFKQLMGFVLMGTVVYLLSLSPPEYVIPTLAMMTAVALACWVYAGTPITASSTDKWQSYALCGAILLGGGVMSFGWLKPDVIEPQLNARIASATQQEFQRLLAENPDATDLQELLADAATKDEGGAWAPFSLQKLQSIAVEQNKTVVVDFGAAWCPTCHVLEETVLNSKPVEEAIAGAGAVTLFADYTEYPPEIRATLETLRSQAVPVLAIFPGGDPYRPIIFRGGYTQSDVIEAIAQASGQPVEKLAAK